jgi:predicted dehydrogenase
MSTTLAFLEPGHFHAALTLKAQNARVAETVHLYATPGPERDAFVALVNAFNERDEDPTRWQVVVHDTQKPLDSLVRDGHADVVVLASKNAAKLGAIAALHAAGIAVLADKPWLTRPQSVLNLRSVTKGLPLALDIMTERHDVMARLRRALTQCEPVFGRFSTDDPDGPAIEIGSKHHLYKRVNGKRLVRPAWYYDTNVQGCGVVDIQSHMTDQVQWLVGGDGAFSLAADVRELRVKRWGTPVDAALFKDSTGHDEFPAAVIERVTNDVLDLQCNSLINYKLRGVPVRQRAEWGQREPDGTGDLHAAHLRGTRAELILDHGPQTDFVGQLHVRPREGEDVKPALRAAVTDWQDAFPGLDFEPSSLGYRLHVPAALRTTHESHFAHVLDDFLDQRESEAWPAEHAARIQMRYELLAAACMAVERQ